jgi:hypothetical protein
VVGLAGFEPVIFPRSRGHARLQRVSLAVSPLQNFVIPLGGPQTRLVASGARRHT